MQHHAHVLLKKYKYTGCDLLSSNQQVFELNCKRKLGGGFIWTLGLFKTKMDCCFEKKNYPTNLK